jgi:hypothetical protein
MIRTIIFITFQSLLMRFQEAKSEIFYSQIQKKKIPNRLSDLDNYISAVH